MLASFFVGVASNSTVVERTRLLQKGTELAIVICSHVLFVLLHIALTHCFVVSLCRRVFSAPHAPELWSYLGNVATSKPTAIAIKLSSKLSSHLVSIIGGVKKESTQWSFWWSFKRSGQDPFWCIWILLVKFNLLYVDDYQSLPSSCRMEFVWQHCLMDQLLAIAHW